MTSDYLVVGSGLTGATIARILADAGRDVAVIERRQHVGGNVHDHDHPSGIRIHTYGPHYFRTGSKTIWNFANRFGAFYPYVASLMSMVDGRPEHWPIHRSYINRVAGPDWSPGFRGVPTNFEEASLCLMPRLIYEKFVKGYTEKQWGVDARTLDAALARRFDVRTNGDCRLKKHRYQGIPIEGYHKWMQNMLKGIPVIVDCDYLRRRADFVARRTTFFSGPIDEFFNFSLGRLQYRGMKRIHAFHPTAEFVQPFAQINHPDSTKDASIRTIEWKHMMPEARVRSIKGSVLTTEQPFTPRNPEEYEYPFPSAENRCLYGRYAALAAGLDRVVFCGRLGNYQYYDMDQAIGSAMKLAAGICRLPKAMEAYQ
jgi:UDP-galactopyranose mutase